MIEEYELILQLGLSNSSGDCYDWDILACVLVQKDDGVFSFDIKWYKEYADRFTPDFFRKHTENMSKPMLNIILKEAEIKFMELLKEKESDNEQY